VFGTWEELAEAANELTETLTSRSGTVTDISTATIDTGGGVADALVVARQIQYW
jgi:hypothetical protein